MDGFDRYCVTLMFLGVLTLSLIGILLASGVQDRVKVLEQAVEAKP